MAGQPRNWAWAFAFAMSIALHVLLGTKEPAAAAVRTPEPTTTDIDVVWLDTELEAEHEEDEAEEDPVPLSATQADPALTTPRPRRPRSPAPIDEVSQDEIDDTSVATTSGTAGAMTNGDTPSESEAATSEGGVEASAPAIDVARLLPSAVAAGTFGPRVISAEEQEAALESALEADLYQIANAADYDTVRPPPELRATGDGGYTYAGHLFTAAISPSGEVSFSDGANFGYSGLGGPSGSLGLGFSFDISAAAEQAAGNDPHAAERRWFMEETERIRDQLAARYRAQIQGRGLVRLRRQLRQIWESSEPAASRRRQIFRLWDSCEEDEVGAEARALIVQFVEEHPGPGRADIFSVAELEQLNEGRVSRELFSPYQ